MGRRREAPVGECKRSSVGMGGLMGGVLIVANQTAGGSHLRDEIVRRREAGQRRFTLLVPPSRPHGTFTWTDGQARAMARHRMDEAIGSLGDLDVEVEGIVGVAPTALDCVLDAVRDGGYDAIVVSTLPNPISHWLRLDLPSRIRERTGMHVTHIVAPARPKSERSKKHAAASY